MANEKILVVDDDANICELLRLYLTKEGYQVTTAGDGEEGLEKFNQIKPDMVLLDVMLPGDGRPGPCARRIRDKAGKTPGDDADGQGRGLRHASPGLELGADDYHGQALRRRRKLVARIKAVLRRCETSSAAAESTAGRAGVRQAARWIMDSYELRVEGKVVEAPPKRAGAAAPCLASHAQPGVHPRPAAGRGVGL